jgi:HPt (histidine-containing phosphotransfer) domain-containing protein
VFRNLKVRTKLLSIVGVVALLFGATVLGLGMVAKEHVVGSLNSELERSNQVIAEFINSRWRQLDAGLNSLVETPEIRAVLTTEGIDHDTQLMSIIDLQHMLSADAIIYCNEKGRTLARTDDPFDEESIVTDIPMIKEALKGKASRGIWSLDGQPLLAIAFPVKQDDLVRGVVLAGVNVHEDGAALKSLLLRDVVVAAKGVVLMSSLPEKANLNLGELLSRPQTIVGTMSDVTKIREVAMSWNDEVKDQTALATTVVCNPTGQDSITSVVFVPASTVFGFYHDFRNVLLTMGAFTIGLSVVVTFKIGAVIAAQVQQTLGALEKVAEGDLTTRLDISTGDEFGSISKALNIAIQASASNLDALAARNRDTKMLLDAVEQGFFTIDRAGVMSDERSGAVDRLLCTPQPGTTLPAFLENFDEKVAGWLEMGIDDVFAEIMPVEVTIDQLPSRIVAHGKTLSIGFTPVNIDGRLEKLAVVVSDITAQVEREQLEGEQREMMAMIHRIAEDKAGFLEFFKEAEDIVEALRSEPKSDLTLVKRRVHTLKGNAAIFGLERIASACHVIEDFIAENSSLPEDSSWTTLFGRWAAVRGYLRRVVGDNERAIDVTEQQYQEVFSDILNGKSRNDLAIRLASWKLEPTGRRMARIAEQARALALRLGKGNISIRKRGGALMIDPEHWSEFWSSFVHVMRNSVDHGLESAEDRRRSGKSEAGLIEIATSVEDDKFVISITDDGRGIDWDRVAEIARQSNLPADTHEQLVEALFVDGLSTATCVTATSGRGVGMGAVRETCARLKGQIEVISSKGEGTTLRFLFPMSMMAPRTIELLSSCGVQSPERAVFSDQRPHSSDLNDEVQAVEATC